MKREQLIKEIANSINDIDDPDLILRIVNVMRFSNHNVQLFDALHAGDDKTVLKAVQRIERQCLMN